MGHRWGPLSLTSGIVRVFLLSSGTPREPKGYRDVGSCYFYSAWNDTEFPSKSSTVSRFHTPHAVYLGVDPEQFTVIAVVV